MNQYKGYRLVISQNGIEVYAQDGTYKGCFSTENEAKEFIDGELEE